MYVQVMAADIIDAEFARLIAGMSPMAKSHWMSRWKSFQKKLLTGLVRRRMICTDCQGDSFERSRFRRWEFLMLLLLKRPFRCQQCNARTFRYIGSQTAG